MFMSRGRGNEKPSFFLLATLAIIGLGGVAVVVTLPRSLRNNNPLNIREDAGGGDLWLGEMAIDQDAAFEEFDAPEYGYRAAARILRNYRNRGLVSVEQIISTWAPGNENNVPAYIASVLKHTGWQPGHIVAESEGDYITLLQAMAIHETGAIYALHPALSVATIAAGVALA